MIEVNALECRIVAHDWGFARNHASDIEAHWETLRNERPDLFNGPVFLMCDWSVEDRGGEHVLRSRHFETDFKSFLAWRDFGFPDSRVKNCFAAAALRSADGGYLLGEMGAHTANAGRVYFPCGTPDREDERNGMLDLNASVLRELKEETGLAEPLVRASGQWTLVEDGPRLACLQTVTSDLQLAELIERASAFLASYAKPELSAIHGVRSKTDLRSKVMPPYVLTFLRAQLSGLPEAG